MNFFVPLCAMRPRLVCSSFRVIPIPLSSIVSVFAALSATMRTRPSYPAPPSSVSERNRFLSHASEPLETSSRRKMSLSE